jgi:lysophospholipase L1-like esterase
MRRSLVILALASAAAAACGGGNGGPTGPTGPTPTAARISRTRFFAFGDSITAGEVTVPIGATGGVSKLVVVPAASYPSVLQSRLASTYTGQASAITVTNQGAGSEQILDGVQRFNQVFPGSGAEVLLLQEGVNGLNFVGPDTSTGLMRIMVQQGKSANARVYVGSMIPTVAGRPRSSNPTALVTYNGVLQIMASQEGITYVDLYNPLLADAQTLIGSDGLHPTEAGYRRIAELFFEALKRDLEVR